MAYKFVQIGPGQDLHIGGDQKLTQWSVSHNKVTKDYGVTMAGNIWSMAQTSGKNYLFLSDRRGH
jgi:WD40 repeat protein